MNRRKLPRRSSDIASTSDLREFYDKLIKQSDELHEELQLTRTISRAGRKELTDTRTKVKKAEKIVLTLTKTQQKAGEAKKAASTSGAAGVAIVILYETWKVVGFPGGYKWMDWWNHEAVFGILMWVSTFVFANAYKLSHDDD